MKTLKQLCQPRESVFDRTRRDVVLDLSDLAQDRIDPQEFFEENYLTDGMKQLFREAFRRFEGHSASGVIRLTQAMGGGKTHNMIALGLLAKYPELRSQIMDSFYQVSGLGPVRVVAFTGRESDAPLGIWGAIAQQLGKKEVFSDYYSPLSAPGQTAWINLLRGEPLLILLDELPPYLEYARSKAIGNSDLSVVTTTALSNLFVAVGKDELANVCIVISDLRATYQSGSQQVNAALRNLENEVGRVALNIEPVGMNTDEVYHILRKRLFKALPAEAEILEIGRGYAQALRDARQMDITSVSPEKLVQLIKESYPFHPAIRDLYARFRENPGFQQTRGLIRLMRVVVSRLFSANGWADQIHLIHAHDLDLNDRETLAEINAINPTLDNAISHDIAANGQAVAEAIDSYLRGTDAQDAAKLLLVSSLANVPNAVVGLSLFDVAAYLCAPGRDVTRLKGTLENFSTSAWYLHSTRDGKFFFKNVQNLIARLKTMANSYQREQAVRELRDFLGHTFAPTQKDCYQEVQVFPAVDDIHISPDKVSLIIYEPYTGGLHPDLQSFYQDLDFKNRVLFLSGQRQTMDELLERAKEHKAINFLREEMVQEKLPATDPQWQTAEELADKIALQLLSAARETFTILTYPHGDQLRTADFLMNFAGNNYQGEQQIREALKARQKFTEDITSDTFRQKCEARLFTQKVMPWPEIKKRAAVNTSWQWHHPDALDHLKNDMVHKDQWREHGTYVEKGPFPPPQTGVQIQQLRRDDDTGEVTLKITPVHGDTVYYEIGSEATTASLRVEDPKDFKTKELVVSFLCVDSTGQHQTGEPEFWRNTITIKSRTFQSGENKMAELVSAPPTPIRYTTDGSNPREHGGSYHGPFVVPQGTVYVLAVAEKDGIVSAIHRREIDWDTPNDVTVDPARPATWHREHAPKTTKETYEFLGQLQKHKASLPGPRIAIIDDRWIELTLDTKVLLDAEQLGATIEHLRGILSEGQVSVETSAIKFPTGQDLLDWVTEAKTELKPGEVEQ